MAMVIIVAVALTAKKKTTKPMCNHHPRLGQNITDMRICASTIDVQA